MATAPNPRVSGGIDAGAVKRSNVPKPLVRSPSAGRLSFRHRAQSIISSKALDELELEVSEGLRCEPSEVQIGSKYSLIAAEVFYSCIWWSVVQKFVITLLLSQKQHMPDVFLTFVLVWLSPLILNCVNTLPIPRHALVVVRLLSLVGVFAKSTPCIFTTLLVLAASNFFAMLSLTGSWWNVSGLDQFRKVYCHLLGYCFLLILKLFGVSVLPQNLTEECLILSIACLCVWHMWWSEQETPTVNMTLDCDNSLFLPGVVSTSVAFGALLFLTHVLLGHFGLINSVSSIEFTEPLQSVFVLFLCLCTLVVLSDEDYFVGHFVWCVIASIACGAFCFMDSLPGYLGGITCVLYVMSAWPLLCSRVCLQPHYLLSIGFLVYFALSYSFFVWLSVSYNFWLLLLSVLAVAVGIRTWCLGNVPMSSFHHHTFFLGRIMNKLPTPRKQSRDTFAHLFVSEDVDRETMRKQAAVEMLAAEDHEYHSFFQKITVYAILLFLLSAACAYIFDATIPEKGQVFGEFQKFRDS